MKALSTSNLRRLPLPVQHTVSPYSSYSRTWFLVGVIVGVLFGLVLGYLGVLLANSSLQLS